jgi:hypothetical protein
VSLAPVLLLLETYITSASEQSQSHCPMPETVSQERMEKTTNGVLAYS